MKKVSNRVINNEVTIFTEIGRLADKYNALKLSQGAPDINPPKWILDIVTSEFYNGTNQYSPLEGVGEFNISVANQYKKRYNMEVDPKSMVTTTSGATEAIIDTIFALVDVGDEVIIFEPFYDSYLASIEWAGGIPVPVTMHLPDFTIDMKELKNAITPRTKCIIVNTPHNPTGKIFSKSELEDLRDICVSNDLYLISDEVYEYFGFFGKSHIPPATISGLEDRTVTISSTGKTLNATGWKIGYTIAPKELTNAIRGIHQFNTFSVSTPVQRGVANVIPRFDDFVREENLSMENRASFLYDRVERMGLKSVKPYSTYFFLSDISCVTNVNDELFIEELIKEAKVALIPASKFYLKSKDEGRRLIRFNFAKKMETLEEAVKRLDKFFKV